MNRLQLGTCPDSWGVWFADDPLQTPWDRFLDEVAEVGYEWLELGPYGYGFTTDMIISDSAVHEMDLVRWLFDEEIVATSVLRPRPTSKAPQGMQDPLIVLLDMASGILVDVELFANAGYGYEVRAEVVGEAGTLALADTGGGVTITRQGSHSGRVPADWRERFGGAFDAEFTDWLRAVAAGTMTGPGSWDGYAAALVTDRCLQALGTGRRVAVDMPERPDFYAKGQE